MKIGKARVTSSLMSAVLFLGLVQVPAAHAPQTPEQLAQQSADAWLALVDSGKFADSWQEASSLFKAHVRKEEWQNIMHASREPFGKIISRKLLGAKYTRTLPGAPDGEYVVIQCDSSFEHKQSAIETITPMVDKDGQWRVSGYFIK